MELNGSLTLSARPAQTWVRAVVGGVLSLGLFAASGGAGAAESRSFVTSDGARLHYLEAGPFDARTVVFVPGWTMPAWIWDRQIEAFQDRWHVVALDPRGQGESEVTRFGYTAERRGADIGELIQRVSPDRPVVLVGWSLGVLDSLAYVRAQGDAHIAGLVLVDNSVGEGPAPVARPGGSAADPEPLAEDERRRRRAAFVAGMFAHDPGAGYRARLTEVALRMDPADERRLLRYDLPREAWRDALYSTSRPVLYVVRPRLRVQAEAVAARPNAETAIFETAGHALFVDEPDRFNGLIRDFLERRIDPS